MKRTLSIFAIVLVMGIGLPLVHAEDNQSPQQAKRREKAYDGKWWLSSISEERSGFLDGAGDCLQWVAHARWLRPVDQLAERIDRYYKANRDAQNVAVITIWQKVVAQAPPAKPRPLGGEVWTNPHGFFNGLYWRQSSESENRGFLEGYISCMRTRVESPAESYSQPISHYVGKIDAYLKSHPKADDEAIATILSRFRDKPLPPSSGLPTPAKTTYAVPVFPVS